ncbi:MAG: thioesterase family protein [Anaerolineales bacterium]
MTITTGLTLTKTFTVKEEHTAFHIGSGTVRVLGTPIMIAYMEITSMELLQEHLDAEHTTVGTRVDIRHLAPSPLGAEIKVTAEVTGVDGAKTTLKVDAWYGETLIGTGTHWRYTINIAQFAEQLDKM